MKSDTNNSQSVCKSQLNHSTAKACFTFTKSPRSPKAKNTNDKFYEKPSGLSNRATFIGFGNKIDLVPKTFNPSPDKYNKPSEFDLSPKKGTSFGLSRQNCKAVSLLPTLNIPGPGAYNSPKNESKGFLMRGRDGFAKIFASTHTPGPGKYQIKQQTQKQFFADSKRKSPFIYTFKKGKQNTQKINNLGPGAYQTGLASMGRQVLAKSKTQNSCVFPKQVRQTLHISQSSVGPGSYSFFSEFGK